MFAQSFGLIDKLASNLARRPVHGHSPVFRQKQPVLAVKTMWWTEVKWTEDAGAITGSQGVPGRLQ
jgi:hypothetical protein